MKHYLHTKGGIWGHVFRRLVHVSLVFVPIVYFYGNHWLLRYFSVTSTQVLSYLVVLLSSLECLRLKLGWNVFGQREYERHQTASVFWGFLAIYLVLTVSKSVFYAPMPIAMSIIISLALIDPLAGECRSLGISQYLSLPLITTVALLIWMIGLHFSPYPLWLSFIIAPAVLLGETIELPNIDDNFTMCLFPLMVCLVVIPLS